MKKLNTLNEEINRMKSLFGESRLYGNLVTEDTEPSPDKVKEVMEPIKKDTLKILSLWKSYNNGLSGISTRVLGKGKIKEEIEKAESIISGMDSKDFCSDATLSKIESKRRELEEVEKKYENILTDKDKGFISRLKGKMNLLKDECKRLKTETSTEEVIDNDEVINVEVPKEFKKCEDVVAARPNDGIDPHKTNYTGLWKECNAGYATMVVGFKNGKPDGFKRSWNTSGDLIEEIPLKNGLVNGVYKTYRYGKIKSEQSYIDSVLDGIQKEYENGKLMREYILKDGRKNGLEKKYYKNGELRWEVNYKDGKKDGLSKYYYQNGQLEYDTNYIDGEAQGISKDYYETGELEIETIYKDGDWGERKFYYKNGNLKEIRFYENGKENGISKFYDESGNLKSEEEYVDGNLISKKEYEKSEEDTEPTTTEPTTTEPTTTEPTTKDSVDIIGVNYRTGKKTIDGVLKKVKDKDGKTTFIIKNRKVPILNPRRNGFIHDVAKKGVMDALYNLGVDTTNKNINVINDRKFTIK